MTNYLDSLPGSDGATLWQIGRDLIQSMIALSVETVFWTVYIVLVFISTRILYRKRSSWMAQILLATVWAMVALDTAMFVIDIRNTVKEVSLTLTSSADLSLEDRYALTDSLPWAVQSALYAFLSNLGDVIVLWRVYVFYTFGKDRWVVLFPLVLLLASFATSGVITFCSAYSIRTGATMVAGNFIDPPLCRNAQMASYCTTLATTGVATLLIWYKTWQYKRDVGKLLRLPKSAQKSRVEKTMLVVIESGVLYFLFFLEGVIAATPSVGRAQNATTGLSFASTVWTYMTSHILCIYPVTVIILVHANAEGTEQPRSSGAGTALAFSAHPPTGSAVSTLEHGAVPLQQLASRASLARNVSLRNMRVLEVAVHKTSVMYADAVPLEDMHRAKKGGSEESL